MTFNNKKQVKIPATIILRKNNCLVLDMFLNKNLSYAKIAKHLKVTRNAVAGYLNRMGVVKRKTKYATPEPEDYEDIINAYSNKVHNVAEIAQKYNAKVSTIQNILKDAKVLKCKIVKAPAEPKPKQKPRINRKFSIARKKLFTKIAGLKQEKLKVEKYNAELFYEAKFPKNGYCKYPVGNYPDFLWCANKATRGSWCSEHYNKCHSKTIDTPLINLPRLSLSNKFMDL